MREWRLNRRRALLLARNAAMSGTYRIRPEAVEEANDHGLDVFDVERCLQTATHNDCFKDAPGRILPGHHYYLRIRDYRDRDFFIKFRVTTSGLVEVTSVRPHRTNRDL